MLNAKLIKIIISIVVILLIIFIYILLTRKDTGGGPQPIDNNTDRPFLNTNVSTSTNNNPTNTNISNPVNYSGENDEDIIKNKISKLLSNWNITKDKNLLIEALTLSENVDNEVIFEAWIPFMNINSGEIIKLIDTSTNKQKTKTTIKGIFEWYIELSGEYEKLSGTKKQQLTNQYNQVK